MYNGNQNAINFIINKNSNNYIVGSASNAVNDTTWTHIIITADRSDSMKMYVDNIFAGGTSIYNLKDTSLDISGYPFTMGSMTSSSTNARIDDLKIYKKVLSTQEINDLYMESPLGFFQLKKKNNSNTIVSPNPFSHSAIVKINADVEIYDAELIIFDVLGKEVKRINNIEANIIKIEREALQNGLYFFQIISGKNAVVDTGKIVIN